MGNGKHLSGGGVMGALALAAVLLIPGAALAGGKDVFLDKGCNNCHAIKSQGIEGGAAGGDLNPPDLSQVGTRQQADFLRQFLRKKAPMHGKMHMLRFEGSKEEFDDLINWLMELKK
ncbi:MAG: cytochrome c [Nitrospirota bacterium]|nr:cytochrome c [Nitrospirota bacterium]